MLSLIHCYSNNIPSPSYPIVCNWLYRSCCHSFPFTWQSEFYDVIEEVNDFQCDHIYLIYHIIIKLIVILLCAAYKNQSRTFWTFSSSSWQLVVKGEIRMWNSLILCVSITQFLHEKRNVFQHGVFYSQCNASEQSV